jgi:hypothetical protein
MFFRSRSYSVNTAGGCCSPVKCHWSKRGGGHDASQQPRDSSSQATPPHRGHFPSHFPSIMVLPLHPPRQLVELLEDAMAEVDNKDYPSLDDDIATFLAFLAEGLSNAQIFDHDTWQTTLSPYLVHILSSSEAVSALIERYRHKVEEALVEVDDNDSYGEEDDIRETDIVVQVNFNLAYGGKILLHKTKLKLLRGRRYALVGQNGVGYVVFLFSHISE